MAWIKVRDGYVRSGSVDYISRSTYVFDGKYRLIFDLSSGATAVYDEYDTKEECEAAIEKLINLLIDGGDL